MVVPPEQRHLAKIIPDVAPLGDAFVVRVGAVAYVFGIEVPEVSLQSLFALHEKELVDVQM